MYIHSDSLQVTYDPAKNAHNVRKHGLSFDRAVDFDFHTAIAFQDTRRDYGEVRIRSLGLLDGRVHHLVFVETTEGIRVISLRKTNRRESRKWLAGRK